jgi:hypothetical protein
MNGKHLKIIFVILIVIFLTAIHYLSDRKKESTIKTSSVNSNHGKDSRVIQGEAVYSDQPPQDAEFKDLLIKYLSKSHVKNVDKNKITITRKKNNLGDTNIHFSVLCDGDCIVVEGHENPANPSHTHTYTAGQPGQSDSCVRILGADRCSIGGQATQGAHEPVCTLPTNTAGYDTSSITTSNLGMGNISSLTFECTCAGGDCYAPDNPSDVPSAGICNTPNTPISLSGCGRKLCNIPTTTPAGVTIRAGNDFINAEGHGNRAYLRNDNDNTTDVLYSCTNGSSFKNSHASLRDPTGTYLKATCINDGDDLIMDGCSQDCTSDKTDNSCTDTWCPASGNRMVQENNLQSGNLFDVSIKCADGYSSPGSMGADQTSGAISCIPGVDNYPMYDNSGITCQPDCIEPANNYFRPYDWTTSRNSCNASDPANQSICQSAGNIPSNHGILYGGTDSNGDNYTVKPNFKYECDNLMDGDTNMCTYIRDNTFREIDNNGNKSSVPTLFDMQDHIECNPYGGYTTNGDLSATICDHAGESYNINESACIKKLIRVPEDRTITRTDGTTNEFSEAYVDRSGNTIDSTSFTHDINSLKGEIQCAPGYIGTPQIVGPNDGGTPSSYNSFMTSGCWPDCGTQGCVNHETEIPVAGINEIQDKNVYITDILNNINTGKTQPTDPDITRDNITYWRQYYYNNKLYNDIQISNLGDQSIIWPMGGDCSSFENIPGCSNVRVCNDADLPAAVEDGVQGNCLSEEKFGKFIDVSGVEVGELVVEIPRPIQGAGNFLGMSPGNTGTDIQISKVQAIGPSISNLSVKLELIYKGQQGAPEITRPTVLYSADCSVTEGTAEQELAEATTCTLIPDHTTFAGSCAVASGSGLCDYVAPSGSHIDYKIVNQDAFNIGIQFLYNNLLPTVTRGTNQDILERTSLIGDEGVYWFKITLNHPQAMTGSPPVYTTYVQLVIIPQVAFDMDGNRVGGLPPVGQGDGQQHDGFTAPAQQFTATPSSFGIPPGTLGPARAGPPRRPPLISAPTPPPPPTPASTPTPPPTVTPPPPPLQEWHLGDLGDTCHQTCQKAGNPGCTDGYWGGQGTAAEQAALFTSAEPSDVLANNSAGAINCGTVVANGGTYAPFVEVPVEGYGAGTCNYQGGSGFSECAAVQPSNPTHPRLCKCDMP